MNHISWIIASNTHALVRVHIFQINDSTLHDHLIIIFDLRVYCTEGIFHPVHATHYSPIFMTSIVFGRSFQYSLAQKVYGRNYSSCNVCRIQNVHYYFNLHSMSNDEKMSNWTRQQMHTGLRCNAFEWIMLRFLKTGWKKPICHGIQCGMRRTLLRRDDSCGKPKHGARIMNHDRYM